MLTLFTAGAAEAANITATASRNPVSVDDSFHLIYEADSSVDDDPDFSPIYVNFDVLSSSQSTNMRSVNGSWSLKKTWDLTIIAKDIGKITIPPISFGKDNSPAIRITVTNSSSANNASPGTQGTIPAKIYLESNVDKKSGWVQSQFLYTIRLFRTVRISGASIADPETDDPDTIIQSLGEDSYQTTRNGIRYEVIERRYAIFPQKSGTLRIKPAIFQGRIQATQPRSIFDQFRMSGQMKRLRSNTIDLDVKPAPADINLQDWLPASNIKLHEEWSTDLQKLKVGEPVTRTITLAAEGLAAVQLPDIDIAEIDGLKLYPDKAVEENRQDASAGLIGLKQIKIALIPGRAGEFKLPEVKLKWWNTSTRKTEIATLPAHTLSVSGASASDTPAQTEPTGDSSAVDSISPSDNLNRQAESPQTTTEDTLDWRWISLFLAIGWILTIILYLKKPTTKEASKARSTVAGKKPAANIKVLSNRVEKAASSNEAHQTRDSLISWAQAFYQDDTITNLSQISSRCSSQLAETIRDLNQALYSSNGTQWHGKRLLEAFKKEKTSSHGSQTASVNSALRPLYNKGS